MDASAFYYTFSTIAQTLAGAFGFLVAVTLYQMQTMERTMESMLHYIRRSSSWRFNDREMQMLSELSDWAGVAKAVSEAEWSDEVASAAKSYHDDRKLALIDIIGVFLYLRVLLRRSMLATGFTIAFCLSCLPFGNDLATQSHFGRLALFASWVGALLSLLSYYPIIGKVTKS